MNPLYRNDKPGQYPPSWYADSVEPGPPRPALAGAVRADLAILGAGYTGLWAALTAARAGLRVVVLDAHRVGFGASGRNGGQVGTGMRSDQDVLARQLGETRARALWEIAEDGKAQLRDFVARHAPEAAYKPGVAYGFYSEKEARAYAASVEFVRRSYGYDAIELLEPEALRALVKSPLYRGGLIDRGAGHVHPLRYALALGRAVEAAGGTIHELSEVTAIEPGPRVRLRTKAGHVEADHAILAGNGYLPPGLAPAVDARVMPINSFIAATEPLPERWRDVLAEDIAVADDKFVVNYFRFSEDRRFLFGGRESYGIGFPAEMKGALVARMTALFPQLKGVAVTHAWGGTLGITVTRLPSVQRVAPNVLSGAGFSGHGVALSGITGRVMAEAVLGQAGRFDILSELPFRTFPGGPALRAPLNTLAMTWYALRDRLGI